MAWVQQSIKKRVVEKQGRKGDLSLGKIRVRETIGRIDTNGKRTFNWSSEWV